MSPPIRGRERVRRARGGTIGRASKQASGSHVVLVGRCLLHLTKHAVDSEGSRVADVPIVVLDTNILVENFPRRHALTLLLDGARTQQLRLLLPEVVVQEAANKFREQTAERMRDLEKARGALEGMGVDVRLADVPNPAGAALRYETDLRAALAEVGAVIAPIPPGHDRLFAIALRGRRPFKADDGGYRDALVWQAVLDAIAEGPEVILCSRDKGFREPGTETDLARELLEDVSDAERVRLAADPKQLAADLVDVEVVAIEEVERAVERTWSSLEDRLESRLYDYDFDRFDLDLRLDAYDVEIPDLDADHVEVLDAQFAGSFRLSAVNVEEAQMLSTDQVLATLHIEGEADLDLDVEAEGYDKWEPIHRFASRTLTRTRGLTISAEATYWRDIESVEDLAVARVRIH
jgi:hypothetical protein